VAGKPKKLTGSVQVKNDTYYIALNTYVDGKRKPTWVPTGLSSFIQSNEVRAEDILDGYINEYNATGKLTLPEAPKSKPLLCTFMQNWIDNLEREETTWESYETYVRAHIIPYFEPLGLRVDEVKPKHIKEYYDFKAKSGRMDGKDGGLSRDSLKKHGSVLRMAFDEAMILEDLERNPVTPVPVPKGDNSHSKTEQVFLSAKGANQLLAAAEGNALKAMIFIALYYGLRRSELIGLKWSAIDLVNDTLEIRYAVVRVRTEIEKERLKNKKSKATFALLDDVKEVLQQIQKETEEYRRAFGKDFVESGFVFIQPNGERYRPDDVSRKFKALLKRQNLPDMRLHDLRHSCASVLYEKGWDMKSIQEWMRHSCANMTSYYTHLTEAHLKIIAADYNGTFTYSTIKNTAEGQLTKPIDTVQQAVEVQPEPDYNVYRRDTLYQEVWERPVSKVAKDYGISGRMMKKLCVKLHVPVPPNGYWSSYRAGMPVEKTPLPPYEGLTVLRGRRMQKSQVSNAAVGVENVRRWGSV